MEIFMKNEVIIKNYIEAVIDSCRNINYSEIINIYNALIKANDIGGKIFICGNGGSASTASHFKTDLNSAFSIARETMPAICLADNLSTLTASYENNYWGVASPSSAKFNGCTAPTNSYASAEEVPSIGEVDDTKYQITYELGDGDWDKDYYTYDEIIADLLADLSAYYGTAVTAEEVHNISENASVKMFDFFLTHLIYSYFQHFY